MTPVVVKPFEFHPIANVFPLLEGAEFEALKEDIRQHGQLDRILVFQEMILDGRNRYRACQELGKMPLVAVFPGTYQEAVDLVVSRNIHRRHLSTEDRALAAAELANLRKGHNQHTGEVGAITPTSEVNTIKVIREERPPAEPKTIQVVKVPAVTQKQAAEKLHVPVQAVKDARVLLDDGIPELVDAVKAKTISLSAGREIAKLSGEDQKVAIKEKWTAQQAKEKRKAPDAERAKKLRDERYQADIYWLLVKLIRLFDSREEHKHLIGMVNQIGHNVLDDWTDGPAFDDDDPEVASCRN